jgi:hypothetical protein
MEAGAHSMTTVYQTVKPYLAIRTGQEAPRVTALAFTLKHTVVVQVHINVNGTRFIETGENPDWNLWAGSRRRRFQAHHSHARREQISRT